MTVRTRFAPSPTGFLHVGGVRTALFAWLVARQAGGQFILRIEDTDQKRLEEGSMDHIQKSLAWLDILWDEGPYKQSDRLEIYQKWAQKLIDAGRAYADPYTPEELQEFRDEAAKNKQPFLYRNHRPENPPVWDGTQPLRFKSEPKAYSWHDEVMGDLSTGPEVIDDFILIKSDGYPTYNFAHIVDDAEMKITHVIRGQEFISSQPNYLNLYEALGFEMSSLSRSSAKSEETSAARVSADAYSTETRSEAVSEDFGDEKATLKLPIFATMPPIMNEQGNKKLSKRDGAKDILDYMEEGYLPAAMRNFLASLGWNDGTEQEVFTTKELIEKFSLDRVHKSGARFDEKRLVWLNGQHIRQIPLDDFYRIVSSDQPGSSGFWPKSAEQADPEYKKQVLALIQDRMKFLADLAPLSAYFFEEPTPDLSLITDNKQLKKLSFDEIKSLLEQARTALESSDWTADAIQDTLNGLLETTGQKPGVLFSLIRIATTWAPFSPQLNDTLALLGQEKALFRLEKTIDFLSKN